MIGLGSEGHYSIDINISVVFWVLFFNSLMHIIHINSLRPEIFRVGDYIIKVDDIKHGHILPVY
jgi:hypothetical protein